MEPIIAIIPSYDFSKELYTVPSSYAIALSRLNAFPVIIPYSVPFFLLSDKIDGILLTGGGDPDPALWNQYPKNCVKEISPMRDSFEVSVIKEAYKKDIPLLGICRGCQMIAVSLGGSLYQDIYAETSSELKHMQNAPAYYPTHGIIINSGSLLYSITQKYYNKVNSFHHQSINLLPPGFICSASASDGVIEAIECPSKRFFMGVQWHPELMTDDNTQLSLFSAFVKSAKKTKEELE